MWSMIELNEISNPKFHYSREIYLTYITQWSQPAEISIWYDNYFQLEEFWFHKPFQLQSGTQVFDIVLCWLITFKFIICSPITSKPLDRLNQFLHSILITSHWMFITITKSNRWSCGRFLIILRNNIFFLNVD